MRKATVRGGPAMKAAGYKFIGAWFSPSDLARVEQACQQAGYNKAPFIRAGAKTLADVILTPVAPIAVQSAGKPKKKRSKRGR